MNAYPTLSSASYVLVARLPTDALPGSSARTWWMLDRSGDEASARQRAFRLIQVVGHLGGEAVLLAVTSGAQGRPAQALIRHLTTSAVPDAAELKFMPPPLAAAFEERVQAYFAVPSNLQGQLRPRLAAPAAEPRPPSSETLSPAELVARVRALEAENAQLRRLLGQAGR